MSMMTFAKQRKERAAAIAAAQADLIAVEAARYAEPAPQAEPPQVEPPEVVAEDKPVRTKPRAKRKADDGPISAEDRDEDGAE